MHENMKKTHRQTDISLVDLQRKISSDDERIAVLEDEVSVYLFFYLIFYLRRCICTFSDP